MKIIPKKNQILGRTVDVVRSESGLELPATENNATIFVLIDAVGPDVTDPDYKEGAIVAPHHINHIYVRGGFHRIIFDDTEILGVVEGISEYEISIGGDPPKKRSGTGMSASRSSPRSISFSICEVPSAAITSL